VAGGPRGWRHGQFLSCTGNADGSIASITEQRFTDNACATASETNTFTMAELDAYFVEKGSGANPYTGCMPATEGSPPYSMNCTDGKLFMQFFEDAFCSPERQYPMQAMEVPSHFRRPLRLRCLETPALWPVRVLSAHRSRGGGSGSAGLAFSTLF